MDTITGMCFIGLLVAGNKSFEHISNYRNQEVIKLK